MQTLPTENPQSPQPGKSMQLMDSRLYRTLQQIARWMDTYYLDPIIGFLLPAGIGDFASAFMALPFIFFSLFMAKSLPLTLAIINYTLWDILIGLIPFFVGDVLDIACRPYRRNLQLIEGYLTGDKATRQLLRRHVAITLSTITLCCLLIWFMVKATLWFGNLVMDFFSGM